MPPATDKQSGTLAVRGLGLVQASGPVFTRSVLSYLTGEGEAYCRHGGKGREGRAEASQHRLLT